MLVGCGIGVAGCMLLRRFRMGWLGLVGRERGGGSCRVFLFGDVFGGKEAG